MRCAIPPGMQPGQQVRIPTPSGQTVTVTLPDRSKWIYSPSGDAKFDVQVPTTTTTSSTLSYGGTPSYTPSSSYSTTTTTTNNNNGRTQLPTLHRGETYKSYDSITLQPYHPPPLGMRSVPVSMNPSRIQPSGRRRALIIGINYTGTRAALRGCINDARNMQRLLMQQGYPNDSSHMVVLTDDNNNNNRSNSNYKPTRNNIFKAMQWLVQGVARGDVLFFHFSGHGAQVPDRTGIERDGLNETIVPVDCHTGSGQITDDELWGSLVYPLPAGVRLTALMDCCHSGTGLDLPYEYRLDKNNISGTLNRFGLLGKKRFDKNSGGLPANEQWTQDLNPAQSQGDVVLFSGCQDAQTSADTFQQNQAGGAMTQSFIAAFEQLHHPTFPDFMATIHRDLKRRRFSQRPQLTSSQPFDATNRIFSFAADDDGHIEPNQNAEIGRMKTRHVRPGRVGGVGGVVGGGGGGAVIAGVAVVAAPLLADLFF